MYTETHTHVLKGLEFVIKLCFAHVVEKLIDSAELGDHYFIELSFSSHRQVEGGGDGRRTGRVKRRRETEQCPWVLQVLFPHQGQKPRSRALFLCFESSVCTSGRKAEKQSKDWGKFSIIFCASPHT